MKKQPTYSPENQIYSNLENFQSIDVEGDWMQVKKRMRSRKSFKLSSLYQAAAIVILILSLGFLTKILLLDAPDMVVAATGEEQQEFTLPDGSQVHLNENAELRYPEKFRRNKRSVHLTGEGFFTISRDAGRPFLVNIADRATVEVLGTSFNIESEPLTGVDNKKIKVQVVEGSVAFYTHESIDNKTILNQGDHAELQKGQISLSSDPDPNFQSWRTGILYFQQSPINEVVLQLEEHYNRELTLDYNIPDDLTFTSTIDNQELEDVLEEMSLVLELTITYNPDTITISKQH